MQTAANVILPDGEAPEGCRVMFLLHGLSDDHTIWCRRTSIERYVDGLPLAVVMPNGGRGFFTDAAEGFAYGRAIGEELPKIVRKHFRVAEDGWCVTGLSMGGYGALRLGLRYPELFRSVASHSGALAFGHDYPSGRDDDFTREFARVTGTNPSGSDHDLFHLAEVCPRLPAIHIDCGTDDFLIESNRMYHSFLVGKGIEHEYLEYPGAHTWAYWDEHVQEAIAFHRRHLGF
jgi:S-formylglutathione hydrolase FrmB